ncbi:hypothetical protein LEP1GSC086_1032, partial [Leptospira weilii str. LNT 1234]
MRKVSKVRTGGSHFLFNDATLKYNSVSDRSGNPATQHVLNAETGIYEKFAMLRCRLKRRARPVAKRRGTSLTSVPYLLIPSKFTSIASTFLSLVNPLKDWEERSEQYEDEYQAKLLELEQTKQSTIANYDS